MKHSIATIENKEDEGQLVAMPFNEVLLNQTFRALWITENSEEERNRQLASMAKTMVEINPQDPIEEMLASQIVAGHNATMRCFAEAMHGDHSPEGRAYFSGIAARLMRATSSAVGSLGHHRGKPIEKRTTIVHVSDGGQAIVGDVRRG